MILFFKRGVLNIPKAKNIPAVFHRKFKGDKIHDVTISKEKDGRYYASILVDTFEKPLPKKSEKRCTAQQSFNTGKENNDQKSSTFTERHCRSRVYR